MLCRPRSSSAELEPTMARGVQEFAVLRAIVGRIRQHWGLSARHRLNLPKSISAKLGSEAAKCGPNPANIRLSWPGVDQSWAGVGADHGPILPLGGFGQVRLDTRRTRIAYAEVTGPVLTRLGGMSPGRNDFEFVALGMPCCATRSRAALATLEVLARVTTASTTGEQCGWTREADTTNIGRSILLECLAKLQTRSACVSEGG